MSAFPPDSDHVPAAPEAEETERPRAQPTKTSWFYVFEKWIAVPASTEDEFVLA